MIPFNPDLPGLGGTTGPAVGPAPGRGRAGGAVKPRKFNIERFAKDLRAYRAIYRLTCRDLEKISGVSNAFINQIENHYKLPNINIILWFCDWMQNPIETYIDQC